MELAVKMRCEEEMNNVYTDFMPLTFSWSLTTPVSSISPSVYTKIGRRHTQHAKSPILNVYKPVASSLVSSLASTHSQALSQLSIT